MWALFSDQFNWLGVALDYLAGPSLVRYTSTALQMRPWILCSATNTERDSLTSDCLSAWFMAVLSCKCNCGECGWTPMESIYEQAGSTTLCRWFPFYSVQCIACISITTIVGVPLFLKAAGVQVTLDEFKHIMLRLITRTPNRCDKIRGNDRLHTRINTIRLQILKCTSLTCLPGCCCWRSWRWSCSCCFL